MLEHPPDWLHAVRLLITLILITCLGSHAFYRFKLLAGSSSPKQWAFFLYSVVFLGSSVLNFVSLLITLATRTYGRMPGLSLGSFTVTLIITYAAFALTVRPSRSL